MATKITIAHSPDSDDAFMFYGFASGAVDTEGLEIAQVLADIETLNRAAVTGTYEVTAASFHAFAHLSDKYALLPHGASMGDNYGPMVVVRQDGPTSLDGVTVAIPGLWTSAWLALQLYQSGLKYVVMPFDEILEAVRDGKVEAGLLIHEGQLTYGDSGLHLWTDLGAWWMEDTGLPLPLGGNAVRRDLGETVIRQIARDLRASIVYALEHRAPALAHASRYNRGIGDERTDTFVGMYVNQWTVDYGLRGRQAVQKLLDRGHEAGVIPERVQVDFVDSTGD